VPACGDRRCAPRTGRSVPLPHRGCVGPCRAGRGCQGAEAGIDVYSLAQGAYALSIGSGDAERTRTVREVAASVVWVQAGLMVLGSGVLGWAGAWAHWALGRRRRMVHLASGYGSCSAGSRWRRIGGWYRDTRARTGEKLARQLGDFHTFLTVCRAIVPSLFGAWKKQ
jgi:hypothetical protein